MYEFFIIEYLNHIFYTLFKNDLNHDFYRLKY